MASHKGFAGDPATLTTLQSAKYIRLYFKTLYQSWGRQHWWPAQSAFEVILGAYLTQNTSCTNVERALGSMRKARILSVQGIRRTPLSKLERLTRPARKLYLTCRCRVPDSLLLPKLRAHRRGSCGCPFH
ncbi:MAG: hypothetical protein WAL71_04480 [Terriglobales bacterium]|jgi:hypothetical protein